MELKFIDSRDRCAFHALLEPCHREEEDADASQGQLRHSGLPIVMKCL